MKGVNWTSGVQKQSIRIRYKLKISYILIFDRFHASVKHNGYFNTGLLKIKGRYQAIVNYPTLVSVCEQLTF